MKWKLMFGQIACISVLLFGNDHRVGLSIDSGPQSVRLFLSGSSVLYHRLSLAFHHYRLLSTLSHTLSSVFHHYCLSSLTGCLCHVAGDKWDTELKSTFTLEDWHCHRCVSLWHCLMIDTSVILVIPGFWDVWIFSHPAACSFYKILFWNYN
jgi:hypothetical protein